MERDETRKAKRRTMYSVPAEGRVQACPYTRKQMLRARKKERACEYVRQKSQMSREVVLTARIELAWLSPLPPQDSVSTNSTTSAQGFDCSPTRAITTN